MVAAMVVEVVVEVMAVVETAVAMTRALVYVGCGEECVDF